MIQTLPFFQEGIFQLCQQIKIKFFSPLAVMNNNVPVCSWTLKAHIHLPGYVLLLLLLFNPN